MLKPTKSLNKRELKEDKFVTTIFKAQSYLQQNSKQLLIAAGSVVAVIALIVMIVVSKQRSHAIASASLTQAQITYQAGQFDVARQSLLSMVETYAGTEAAGIGHHLLGNMFIDARQYDEALKQFQIYLDDYGDDPVLRASSQAGIASCYEEQGNLADAAAMFRKAADEQQHVFLAPEYLMNAARCFRGSGNVEGAQKACQDLLDRYPESFYRQQAEFLQAQM